MNWTLLIIIAGIVVAFGFIVWLTLGILAFRAARKMQAEISKDFDRHFDRFPFNR